MKVSRFRSSAWPVYAGLAVFSLALLGGMGFVLYTSVRASTVHAPLARAAGRIKLDATLAHLWFEEILSGDRHESMGEVWGRLESSRRLARAMVAGGRDEEGAIVPLADARLAHAMLEVERKLAEFARITRERRDSRSGAASGTTIDQDYDAVFGEIVALTDDVEIALHRVIRNEARAVRRVQLLVIGGAIAMSVVVGVLFHRYSREKEHAEASLRLQIAAEETTREHLERLAHVIRLSTMSELAAGIAHEINQPLAAITAAAAATRRLADAGRVGSIEYLSALNLIGIEAERASRILRRLQTFVRKRASRYEVVDVNAIVRDIVRLADFDPGMRQAKIRLELADDLLFAEADEVQIQQVLLNLLRNGHEASADSDGPQGEIMVRTRRDEDCGIEVAVVDHGSGVPGEIAADPFRPFATTKESGMGMGLSISHSIIAAHGGRLWFRPNEGRAGTTFLFRLPPATK